MVPSIGASIGASVGASVGVATRISDYSILFRIVCACAGGSNCDKRCEFYGVGNAYDAQSINIMIGIPCFLR